MGCVDHEVYATKINAQYYYGIIRALVWTKTAAYDIMMGVGVPWRVKNIMTKYVR